MTRRAALFACTASWVLAQQPPYKDGRQSPSTFEGPGREFGDPPAVREVLLGYFGPDDERHPEGGSVWQGATLAVEDANRLGGYRGKPFRLLQRWDDNPWRGGARIITRMAFVDRVPVLIGSVEGAGTHLAEQVAAKALLPLINPAATDRSIHMAGVPWMFSVVQGDDLHASALARALEGRSIVLLSATEHDSRAFAGYFRKACGRGRSEIKLRLEFDPGRPDLTEIARSAAGAAPGAVVVLAAVRDSARLVRLIRAERFTGVIAGGPSFGRSAFVREAGAAAEGALFPWVGQPAADFRRLFVARFGSDPDYAAAGAYDAVGIAVRAIRASGLNRPRIRDFIAALPPWEGAGGRIEWDEFGQNRRPSVVAVVGHGEFRAWSSSTAAHAR